jgi:glycosidase
VEEVGVDGFRCDVAGMVPLGFWNFARVELDKIQPVFLLAEWEAPEAHEYAFDMTYGWDLYHLTNRIAKGLLPASAIGTYLDRQAERYRKDAYRMYFTSNHDENSWNGTEFERLGEAAPVVAVLTATLNGMPLVYSGQEVGLNKRLAFFEKDLIPWQDHELTWFYKILLNLKLVNRALWNGTYGGEVNWIHTSNDRAVFAFLREKDGDRVFVALNLSREPQDVSLQDSAFAGRYQDVFTGADVTLAEGASLSMEPWDFLVLAKTRPGRGLIPAPLREGDS